MKLNYEMALQTKKQEAEKDEEKEAQEERVEKHFILEREAKRKMEKDLVNQKDRMQQRLAERKRSRAIRATSQLHNQTLPLNFEHNNNRMLEGPTNDISVSSVQVPMMQTSAMTESI